MFNFLFGNALKDALRKGATIIDVRTAHEYDIGRVRSSINIPVDRIPSSVERIRHLNKPIIICGNGDNRSAAAIHFLKQQGLTGLINGGNWEKVLRTINKL